MTNRSGHREFDLYLGNSLEDHMIIECYHPSAKYEEIPDYHVIEISAVEQLEARIKELQEHLKLALSFAPKGPVPEGLASMFYHTLNYADEVELQGRIDKAREALLEDETMKGGAE